MQTECCWEPCTGCCQQLLQTEHAGAHSAASSLATNPLLSMHTNTRAALLCPRAALRPTENRVTEPHAVQCCCAQPDHSTGQQQHAEKGRDIAEYKKRPVQNEDSNRTWGMRKKPLKRLNSAVEMERAKRALECVTERNRLKARAGQGAAPRNAAGMAECCTWAAGGCVQEET